MTLKLAICNLDPCQNSNQTDQIYLGITKCVLIQVCSTKMIVNINLIFVASTLYVCFSVRLSMCPISLSVRLFTVQLSE